MSNFFKLLYNEQIKIYIRKSTWVMYLLLAAIILGIGLMTNSFGNLNDEYQGDDWREVLQEENASLTEEMEKEEAMSGFNSTEIAKNNYYLEHDIQPSKYDAWQFVMENQMLLSLVTLFTIIVAAGIIANEFKWGTIKLLLIRPISRTKILLSKYISVLLFAFLTLLTVLVFSWIVGAILFGVNGMDPHIVQNKMSGSGFEYISVMERIAEGYGYQLVTLLMMATFAFMISSIFRQSSLAIGLAIFLMFAGSSIVGFFADKAFAKYILFANTNLQQYAYGEPLLEGMSLGFSITVLAVYYVIFLAVTWLFFTKRDVAGH
ncbi:ABC transporter permease [Lentibacillus sp. Marseille-P4043]|uniref:ABC transporter permease n=1 Tax=Lentibacillus sp. Marseille-P4043 TaxID=2040293 RepID=UPI000D0BA122|nr:ABC transporter permease [Lentibacillus sp. Marseille-P4043]